MFTFPPTFIENIFAPLVAAQIFIGILIYFTLVRKHLAANYTLYACFLVTFILFLLGRLIQQYVIKPGPSLILCIRMSLLFSVGVPSLLIAAAQQAGIKCRRALLWIPYGVGLLISVGYSVCMDALMGKLFFTADLLSDIPYALKRQISWAMQLSGMVGMLVVPSLYLIVREWRSTRNRTLLAFLVGIVVFGLSVVISYPTHSIKLYYLGSMFSAFCWAWAVVQDVRDMKGKVGRLKEELERLIQAGNDTPEIEKLLGDLEEISAGDLQRYKMRIREILSRLTDVTIDAGGDSKTLTERNQMRGQAIDASMDAAAIREIIRSEAVELSGMIAGKDKNSAIEKAQEYIHAHFCGDLVVDDIAAFLAISRAHLMREFKRETGRTVNRYITALRMERAKELLHERSVTDTAFDVGYNDSNYFSTVFKKQTGLTPLQYKKEHLAPQSTPKP